MPGLTWSLMTVLVGADLQLIGGQSASDVSHVHKGTHGGGCQYFLPGPRLPSQPQITHADALSIVCYVNLRLTLLKSFLFCKSSLPQPFLFLLQDSLYGFPILFTVTSEHIRLFTF